MICETLALKAPAPSVKGAKVSFLKYSHFSEVDGATFELGEVWANASKGTRTIRRNQPEWRFVLSTPLLFRKFRGRNVSRVGLRTCILC